MLFSVIMLNRAVTNLHKFMCVMDTLHNYEIMLS